MLKRTLKIEICSPVPGYSESFLATCLQDTQGIAIHSPFPTYYFYCFPQPFCLQILHILVLLQIYQYLHNSGAQNDEAILEQQGPNLFGRCTTNQSHTLPKCHSGFFPLPDLPLSSLFAALPSASCPVVAVVSAPSPNCCMPHMQAAHTTWGTHTAVGHLACRSQEICPSYKQPSTQTDSVQKPNATYQHYAKSAFTFTSVLTTRTKARLQKRHRLPLLLKLGTVEQERMQ